MNLTARLTGTANTDSQTEWRVLAPVTLNRGSKHPYNRELLRHLYSTSTKQILMSRVDDWIDQTSWHSSITSMTRHPLFAAIVDMGREATQYVLQRMAAGDIRLHFFPILQDTTHTDPVPPHSRGNLQEMAAAWTNWGRANHLL
jgi:hypothetical protein